MDVFTDRLAVPPTAVRLISLTAERRPGGVVLHWRTATETETLGFNVYCEQRGRLIKLNRSLIPSASEGSTSGHGYSWLDRRADAQATRYRLQAVSVGGTRSWLGSARAAG